MSPARVVIGAPIYNHVEQAHEAFESLLAQTVREFVLVVVDDGSTDGTWEIAQEYARLDPRVRALRNERRVGMIENWRRAFQRARETCPKAEYFAWASDHDLWHPRWLSVLLAELDAHPEAALAYPLNTKVYADGSPVDRKPWHFDTAGITDVATRLERTSWDMSAGNMIYGLFRVRPLERAGVFRRVLVPDRLLLCELSLFGEFRQVPQILWFRRWYGRVFSLSRQRASFFPDGRPIYAYLPWWLSHTVAFAWHVVARGTGCPGFGRLAGLGLTWRYARLAVALHAVQQSRALRMYLVERYPGLRGTLSGGLARLRSLPLRGARWATGVARRARKRVKNIVDEAIRIPGVAFLKAVRAIPLVRSRAIPWLLREEINQIPSARAVIALTKELRRIAAAQGPILVGPWLSEVGFELLYWIPFLNWAAAEHGLARDRLIVVSRGGAECWYRDLCTRSLDLFDLLSVEEYRQKNEGRWSEGGNQKQYAMSEFDHEIVELARDRLGVPGLTVLHPSLMYQLFRFYWYEKAAVSILRDHCAYRPLPDAGPPPEGLPRDYIAARFYFRPSFPDTTENRAFVASVLRTLARRRPVVLLNTGLRLDDHDDYLPASDSGIYRVEHLMAANRNLETQTRIIAHARGFVGTYGGLSYLGPFYGVPAVAFYSHASELVAAHLDMTERMCRTLGVPLMTLNLQAAELMSAVFDGLSAPGQSDRGSSALAG